MCEAPRFTPFAILLLLPVTGPYPDNIFERIGKNLAFIDILVAIILKKEKQ